MKTYSFKKYQGTGNDFVIMDNRNNENKLEQNDIKLICDRRFGVGADGLIFLESSDRYDFKMVYFNADGKESTMCGNGGRCIVQYAYDLGIIGDNSSFEAVDGMHEANIDLVTGIVSLRMKDVVEIDVSKNDYILDTGSPHLVKVVEEVDSISVKHEGSSIRYSAPYKDTGINVNFAEKLNDNYWKIRTYERGVEDETLSCGTGVTAVAVALAPIKPNISQSIRLDTPGGTLHVSLIKNSDQGADHIWLSGPAVYVYEGKINL